VNSDFPAIAGSPPFRGTASLRRSSLGGPCAATASSQALTGTERVYFMRVEGNRLTMKSPGVIVPMTGKTSIVEIELVKAD